MVDKAGSKTTVNGTERHDNFLLLLRITSDRQNVRYKTKIEIVSELYHGQTLTVVIILFRGTSSKYFSDLIARLPMCFVCVIIKACIVLPPLHFTCPGEFFLRVLIRCLFSHFSVRSSILCTSWQGRRILFRSFLRFLNVLYIYENVITAFRYFYKNRSPHACSN